MTNRICYKWTSKHWINTSEFRNGEQCLPPPSRSMQCHCWTYRRNLISKVLSNFANESLTSRSWVNNGNLNQQYQLNVKNTNQRSIASIGIKLNNFFLFSLIKSDIILQLTSGTSMVSMFNLVTTSVPQHLTCTTGTLIRGLTSSVCVYPSSYYFRKSVFLFDLVYLYYCYTGWKSKSHVRNCSCRKTNMPHTVNQINNMVLAQL